ncbi:5-deoxy-glucuronate isomerase [Modestobacter sp. I12A-02628]|uniref:5-deoxy-glucuronate isomerase n=1 Tax=Goekera deserti TaxID=2497753 RepID=A0A7K3WAF6_9ACTN|nr:5-deoxy-glucuronate isomerase [Goekera deserti]MPQ98699.1 5-deoxy-glucuronate isomerase [Goekera deserti]NDI49261.1 5-deoxy-glucuronate isomerase [Goekera deserti]NEL52999.1 5-deoxy-glucuronate isomerase [Goekera deserti]
MRLHHRAGTLARGDWALDLDPERAGWDHTGLKVAELAPGGSITVDTGPDEVLVVPLAGSCTVTVGPASRHDGHRGGQEMSFLVAGRRSVFDGATDLVYAGRGSTVTVTSEAGGRFAVPTARAATDRPARYLPVDGVPVELRGAGSASREVRDLGTPAALPDADSIIVCEVLTPAGNWSSWPPHKHDEDRPGQETVLEEVYYFELSTPGGLGYQRVYGTADRPLDLLAEVRSGDVVLVPHGWHGPSMAAPGYDLYYLNVMAGPGAERAWRICDDPEHTWVRGTWADQQVDPRLPFGSAP